MDLVFISFHFSMHDLYIFPVMVITIPLFLQCDNRDPQETLVVGVGCLGCRPSVPATIHIEPPVPHIYAATNLDANQICSGFQRVYNSTHVGIQEDLYIYIYRISRC